jgi:acyl-CoA thioesterase-1
VTARRWPAAAAALLVAVFAAGGAAMANSLACAVPASLYRIDAALTHAVARIADSKQLKVVAIGSSSTQGVGASTPAMSYPSRLERALQEALPGVDVRVVNHGIGGQDVGEEVGRLERDVIAEHPDLVIWQVGTNAVLRHDDLTADELLIRGGVSRLKEQGIDVVLMDLQFAPRVVARPAWSAMEDIISETAREAHIGLFHRFAMMRQWAQTQQLAPDALIGPDGLHMTDASYGCLAVELAEALVRQLQPLARHAAASPGSAATAAPP